MDVGALIDAVVRQTTILVAQLATAGGSRARLAHTADQVFMDLVTTLKDQGLASKVIADMFGLALRTYHAKVQRLAESRTMRGQSLWSALLEHIERKGPIFRSDVLARFSYDDPISVRGVLRDLVDSGMIYSTGSGDHDGRVRVLPAADDLPAAYTSDGCVLPLGDTLGWEVAVFDHYQAVVSAICNKLRSGATHARHDDLLGGSTYSFDLTQDHPFFAEVTGFLAEFRARSSELRKRVADYNRAHPSSETAGIRVIHYAGQNVVGTGETEE